MAKNPCVEIAEKIIALMSQGISPWRQDWKQQKIGLPANFLTSKPYRGINYWTLLLTSISRGWDSRFLTYKQAQTLGGNVREGEKGSRIVYWARISRVDETTGETKSFSVPRAYTVFSVSQCENLEIEETLDEDKKFEPIEAAEKLISFYMSNNGPSLVFGGNPAYRPAMDQIIMPKMADFASPEAYYATLFHEIGHSTGARSRKNRDLSCLKESHSYAEEELVAEFCAAMLCMLAGISNGSLDENHAAYLKHWSSRLVEDSTILIKAMSAAQKAVDLITGIQYSDELAEAA